MAADVLSIDSATNKLFSLDVYKANAYAEGRSLCLPVSVCICIYKQYRILPNPEQCGFFTRV